MLAVTIQRPRYVKHCSQMQQVEVHALAEQRKSTPEQLELVREVSR
jgi:hypothetical protein